jgi:hypothetical protein
MAADDRVNVSLLPGTVLNPSYYSFRPKAESQDNDWLLRGMLGILLAKATPFPLLSCARGQRV